MRRIDDLIAALEACAAGDDFGLCNPDDLMREAAEALRGYADLCAQHPEIFIV